MHPCRDVKSSVAVLSEYAFADALFYFWCLMHVKRFYCLDDDLLFLLVTFSASVCAASSIRNSFILSLLSSYDGVTLRSFIEAIMLSWSAHAVSLVFSRCVGCLEWRVVSGTHCAKQWVVSCSFRGSCCVCDC